MTIMNQSTRKSIHRRQRQAPQIMKRFLAMLMVILVVGQVVPAQAEVLGEQARKFVDASLKPLFMPSESLLKARRPSPPQNIETPAQAATRVSSIRLCPRQLKLYEGEIFPLSPEPLDNTQKTVHSTQKTWQSSAPSVADIDTTGELKAKGPGNATVTLTIGNATATVAVQVLPGFRPIQTNEQWNAEHPNDCDTPISANPSKETEKSNIIANEAGDEAVKNIEQTTYIERKESLRDLARDASLRTEKLVTKAVKVTAREARAVKPVAATAISRAMYIPPPPNEGEGDDYFSQNSTAIYNAIGSPNYSPQEAGGEGGVKTKRNLGSSNYSFTAPILSLGGRGIGVNLAMTYNSRLWNKEGTEMQFNYNRGWPAAGWTLGYGRIIENYDGTGTGNFSNDSFANSPGNYLLLQPDGTRIHLEQSYDSTLGRWLHKSKDGSNLQLNPNKNLRYPDGTKINYSKAPTGKLVPIKIITRNGDFIVIDYRPRMENFKFRWAINQITDTLGRIIKFHYYSDPGYPVDEANGKMTNAVAAITAPDYETGQPKTLVKLEYMNTPIDYDFANNLTVPVDSVPSELTVVRKIYYPDTGRGFYFDNFSSYGMARTISTRIGMTESSGIIQIGTEIATTKYNYSTNTSGDPDFAANLPDSPKFTERKEYWSGKTDAQGNATSQETIYRYQRMPGMNTDTVYYPNSTNDINNYLWKVVTTTWGDGTVSKVEIQDKNDVVLQKTETSYTGPGNGNLYVSEVKVTNEAGELSRTAFEYYTGATGYGRLQYIIEFDYLGTRRRRTEFEYINDQAYIDERMLNLVKWKKVCEGNNLATPIAQTRNFYDDYDGYPRQGASGMQTYAWIPDTHVPGFDGDDPVRGNVTMTRIYTDVSGDAYQDRWSKYDIFGNVVESQVSCCNYKQANFASGLHWYSQPDSTTDGIAGTVPYLTTSFEYDFSTGLVISVTAPNGQSVNSSYDSAWRQLTVSVPSTGVTRTTSFDKDGNQKDKLSYFEQLSYTDVTAKTITSRSVSDGAGHTVKAGTGAGSSPSSYDMASVVYDHLGRVARQSNPFQGDFTTGSSPYYSENTYDLLSRVTQVKLPDNQLIQTSYNGSQVTVTDQVGRQRESQTDALGRVTSLTEPDPATGLLSWVSNYFYDALDNLTKIEQGGQLREYKFDGLSRLLFERTPEQSQTVNGAGGPWSVKYTYTDFNAVDTRLDAKGVLTDYGYDALHRLESINYTIPGGSGVEATANVSLSYNTSGGGNGQVSSVNNGTASESFSYDTIGRMASVQRTFTGNSNTYTTSYEYNAINQVKSVTYPSLKKVQATYDSRGRLNKLDKYSGTQIQSTYLSGMLYNTAGQVTDYTFGNTVAEHFDYSADRLQLTKQTATKSSNILLRLNYNYQAAAGESGTGTTAGNTGQLMGIVDLIGQPSQINGQGRTQSFTYDNVGRLKTATGWGAWQRRFDYDRFSNRTAVYNATSNGTQIQSVSLQLSGTVPTNRLLSVTNNGTPANYQYDNGVAGNGNLTHDGQNNYSYDAENRLVKVDGGAAVYEYDSSNRRVKKTVGASVTYYIWEGGSVIAEYSNGQVQGSGGLKYYHADRLSTRMITNSSGAVIGTQDHLPFGEDAQSGSGENEKHRFTNYERDENGTDYAVNRQYSNSTGRFLRPDPIDGSIGDPQTFNRYAYVANDPVNAFDPLGLQIACFTVAETVSSSYIDFWGEEVIVIGVTERRVCINFGSPSSTMSGRQESVNGGIRGYSATSGPTITIADVQRCLDVLGFVFDAADIINSSISIAEGNYVDAGFSGASAFPVLGIGATVMKWSRKIGKLPGPTLDPNTGKEVGRFIVDSKGNTMIEPVGGGTIWKGDGPRSTQSVHTLYPNGSNYQRLDPVGHKGGKPHGHGHLEGPGSKNPGAMSGQGPSISTCGKEVKWNSKAAHWTIKR
jgi:RHS repeat-associated protein